MIEIGAHEHVSNSGDPRPMATSVTKLQAPATESQKSVVLVVCVLVMSIMCVGLIWQAQIISNQRDDIRWLRSLKFGG
jgi:hypothetical protein